MSSTVSRQPYAVSLGDILMVHDRKQSRVLRDGFDAGDKLEIQALVASGDCFEVLASNLDQLGHRLTDTDTQIELEHIVQTLLYLQKHYHITHR